MKIESMKELTDKLEKHFPDIEFETTKEVVDAIVELGHADKVHAFDDDYLGLESSLSPKFLKAPIGDTSEEAFELDLECLLEQAETTIGLTERVLSEEQVEDVKEDYISRGLDPDDVDI